MDTATHLATETVAQASGAAAATGGRLCECHDCGCFQTVPHLAPGMVARCLRCAAVLRRGRRDPLMPTLALALTGLILLAVATDAPFLRVQLYGRGAATHFTSGVVALDQYGMWGLALVVLVTTVLAPLAKLLCTVVVLGGLRVHTPPRRLYMVFRLVGVLRPWAMIEVYMLGIFVAYTKLREMAQIDIGIAAYALAALMLTMVAADALIDPEGVWEELEERGSVADPARIGQVTGPTWIGCPCCGLVRQCTDGEHCPRCGATVHRRRVNSLSRTTALLVGSAILYVPANLYPILTLVTLGRGAPSTILSGVQQLLAGGMWPLALLVFVASITVPLLKILGLGFMLISVRRNMKTHLRDRTLLYRIVESVGRWSMIDVFMISILVGLVHLGFFANVQPGVGAMAFAGVVVLTMLSAMTFDPRRMWDAAGRNAEGEG